MQLRINNPCTIVFEWIPYDQFNEIGKGAICLAIWKDGPLYYEYMVGWTRESDKKVALKCLYNSQNLTSDFLNEVSTYSIDYIDDNFKIYGISQNPNTKDYIMVLQYEYCEKCVKCDNNYVDAQYRWCELCQANDLENNFTNWTSNNEKIDHFIREAQLKINDLSNIIFEWIPYNQFYDIIKDDFSTIYSAKWKDGPLSYSMVKKKLTRQPDKEVAFKSLYNSKDINNEFLNEPKAYLIMNSNFILNIYGISQNPKTKDYIMVLESIAGENLNDWVNHNYKDFNWSNKIRILFYIIQSLKEIHQKQMIHRDFHTGNMLISTNGADNFNIIISNMGSCGEVGNIDETKIYGDIRYTAPEVLNGKFYTQAADIYSFGMIMYYVVTGNHPRDGIKPEIIGPKAPKRYIDLMEECLDLNPDIRPKVSEIEELINLFCFSYLDSKSDFKRVIKVSTNQYYEIRKQFEEAEEYRKTILSLTVDPVDPYIPLIQTASGLIMIIIEVCQAAEYNKRICRALAERVEITTGALELLKLKKEKELRDEVYYDAFNKFIYTLEKIKNYIGEISKIHGFKKYTKAIFVKEKFMKLTEEYDTVMKDLNFTSIIANEERKKRDEEALSGDLAEFDKYLRTMGDQVDNIYEEVMYIKKHLDDKTFRGANKIDSKELMLPARGKPDDQRGKGPNFVVRRILGGQEVACKSNSTIEDDTKLQGHLEILMKLSECNHILRFYGVSKIDDDNVRVFEWAHRGTLKELYEKKDIQWHYKVQIALKICRGLIFLQKAEILHHDLRCENILMTESLEPKIYNFKLARYTFGNTTTIKETTNDAVRWLAPEKLINYKSKYTTQCEIFSFGVLLWELAFEKIPYRSLEVDKVRDFVIKGGRERIKFGDSTPEISKLQENYKEIIINIWKNNPQERISFLKVLDMLEELYNSINYMFDENLPALLEENTLDLDGSKANDEFVLPDDFESLDDFIDPVVPIIPLDEGIIAHKVSDYQKAWKCFEYHARNGNTTAKFWKGRYLWEGIHDGIKEREEGRELLKEVADEGHHDAQLYYAFTLKKSMYGGNNIEIFMNYITKAAEGNNHIAQYNLGDIYYKGKLNITKNENEGIKWLKKAALNDNNRATQFLEKEGIKIY